MLALAVHRVLATFPFFFLKKNASWQIKIRWSTIFVCQWLLKFGTSIPPPLPPKNKKHHKSAGSSNFELSFHPHYVISLPFNVFQRDFCVDGSLLQITRGAVKILKWNTERLQVNKALRYQSSIKASGCCCGVSWWADTPKRFKRSL